MSSGNFLFLFLIILGPILRLSSSNWLICWVGIEVTFLGLIPLLVSSERSFFRLRKESSIKYFCIQALGRGILLFRGITLFILPVDLGVFPSILFLVRLLIKLGVFPTHFWVPGVVSGLSIFSIFLVLTWQKIVPFFLLVSLLDAFPDLQVVVLFLGGLRALVGAIIGLNQTQLGPILGASSITHGGWLILGSVYGNIWVYFVIYCINFSVLVYFLWVKDNIFRGLLVLSLSGLPPFFIFIGKWAVFKAVLSAGGNIWRLLLPLLGSVIRLFFYLKFFYSFYLEEKNLKLKTLGYVSFSALLGLFYVVFF